MFKLLRRISVGVIPRPDRPWDEDRKSCLLTISFAFLSLAFLVDSATSNAPRTSRKRRLSSAERDDTDEGNVGKKVREDTASPSVVDVDARFLPGADTKEVKEVTQGVKEVELEDNLGEVPVGDAAPETIPLPEETSGELDEPASDDVDDAPERTEETGRTPVVELTQVAVEQSASPTDECEELDSDKKAEAKPASEVAEPMSDANARQTLDHP